MSGTAVAARLPASGSLPDLTEIFQPQTPSSDSAAGQCNTARRAISQTSSFSVGDARRATYLLPTIPSCLQLDAPALRGNVRRASPGICQRNPHVMCSELSWAPVAVFIKLVFSNARNEQREFPQTRLIRIPTANPLSMGPLHLMGS
ncbi:hypothetical protein PG993_012656 [Apiospora rasikravindrae]|uniref:Uncharacterized protein n=1 Tax=Apiospora rasikravindrae TaxID=990691 RepID=A0ABR1S4G6_9PEZI